jgi:hypothetical protein
MITTEQRQSSEVKKMTDTDIQTVRARGYTNTRRVNRSTVFVVSLYKSNGSKNQSLARIEKALKKNRDLHYSLHSVVEVREDSLREASKHLMR